MGDSFLEEKETDPDEENILDVLFPHYFAMGMSYEEYWHGNPYLAELYRKKQEIEWKKKNEELWLQGKYMHDGFMIALDNMFKQKNDPVMKYLEEPYPLTEEDGEAFVERKNERAAQKTKEYFEQFKQQTKERRKHQERQ